MKISTSLKVGYREVLDTTQLLSEDQANYFQNLIEVLHWVVELGQIRVHVQVVMLSSYLVQPCQGHMETVFHIFAN